MRGKVIQRQTLNPGLRASYSKCRAPRRLCTPRWDYNDSSERTHYFERRKCHIYLPVSLFQRKRERTPLCWFTPHVQNNPSPEPEPEAARSARVAWQDRALELPPRPDRAEPSIESNCRHIFKRDQRPSSRKRQN